MVVKAQKKHQALHLEDLEVEAVLHQELLVMLEVILHQKAILAVEDKAVQI